MDLATTTTPLLTPVGQESLSNVEKLTLQSTIDTTQIGATQQKNAQH